MKLAIKEVLKSKAAGDYAVGAVVVKGNRILAHAGNSVRLDEDPTHHAEVVVIQRAAKAIEKRHLDGCILYTTHEPCAMCTSAAIWARFKGIVFGAKISDMAEYANKNGNQNWSWRTIDIPSSFIVEKGTPKLILCGAFMREECRALFHTD